MRRVEETPTLPPEKRPVNWAQPPIHQPDGIGNFYRVLNMLCRSGQPRTEGIDVLNHQPI